MIIKEKHNYFIYKFFKNYAIWKVNNVFENVSIIGNYENKNKSVLVVANHVSWWDGFWIMYLNLKILHRKFHFMMLEEQLKKYWFFKYSGGFSVNKKSKTIIESLKHTVELLEDKNNMVLIFPQGEIQSIYKDKLKFEKGIDWILKNSSATQYLSPLDGWSKITKLEFINFAV